MCPNQQYVCKLLSLLLLITALPIAVFAQPYAYVSNISGNNVSVVNAANNTVVASIPVDASPEGLAVTPNGALLYLPYVSPNKFHAPPPPSTSIISSIPL